jgi:hypothetical protein
MDWNTEFSAEYAVPAEVIALVTHDEADDLSWVNDACPSFGTLRDEGVDGVRLFVEHPDATRRTLGSRFVVLTWDAEGSPSGERYAGDDVVAAVAAYLDARKELLDEEEDVHE